MAYIYYGSITTNYTNEWRQWWLIFPGSQIGTRDTWTKLHHLSTTDYLTYEEGKFFKSRVIGVFGDLAQKTAVASDAWRCYLISHRRGTSDPEFNWDSFIGANNNLLLKNLGNFVSRVVKFVNSTKFNNVVPDYLQCNTMYLHLMSGKQKQTGSSPNTSKDWTQINPVVRYLRFCQSRSRQMSSFLQSNSLDNKLAEKEPLNVQLLLGLL
ncbi:tRNA synthetases class I (M)-domain-containing protein [Aspergillus varians]